MAFNSAYDGYAFSAPVGQLSGPLAEGGTSPNFYVVRVIDRSEQPVREDQKSLLAEDKMTEWLTNTKAEMESAGALVNKFQEDDQTEALLAVYNSAVPRLAEQQSGAATGAAGAADRPSPSSRRSPATPAPATPAAESSPSGGATAPAQPPAPVP